MNERYQHLSSGVIYRMIIEVAGLCELENIERGTIYRSREQLSDAEIWRRMP